jgi:hypothetical protein
MNAERHDEVRREKRLAAKKHKRHKRKQKTKAGD